MNFLLERRKLKSGRGKRRLSAGFTLIELLVALTIFSVGLLAIAGMQVTGVRENSRAHTVTTAGEIAQGILEDILSRDGGSSFFSAAGSFGWDFDPDTVAIDPLDNGVDGTYSVQYTITVNDPVNKVTKIVVSVTGTGRQLSLTGYKRTT